MHRLDATGNVASRDLDPQGLQRHGECIVMQLIDLADWLAESGLRNLPLEEMVDGFSRRLNRSEEHTSELQSRP